MCELANKILRICEKRDMKQEDIDALTDAADVLRQVEELAITMDSKNQDQEEK